MAFARAGSRRRSALTRGLQGAAALLAASLLGTALHDVSTAWDVWYYHLPFAARLAGLVPREAYAFHALNEARYQGFPLLGELLQGVLWRAVGRPEASNLVALGSVAAYAWLLRRLFRVPLHLTALGLLAVPLVQLHATACYVDLPAGLLASALVLGVYRLYTTDEAPSGRMLALLGAAAAGAANMRFQLHALVGLGLLVAAPRVLGPLWRALRGPEHAGRSRALRQLAGIAIALPLVVATPLRNAVVHGNPYYPMRLAVAGLALPGVESVYSSEPPYLEHAPRPQRFLYSLLEVGIRPMSDPRRWTIDQWMPQASGGNRMGGFFGAYVLFHLGALAFAAARDRSRQVRVAALLFAGLTAVTSWLPQSHELRYYVYWMIVLVSLNLVLAVRAPAASPGGGAVAAGQGRGTLSPELLGLACALALAVVLGVTRAGYAYPSGSTFAELLASRVDPAVLARVRDGERLCLGRAPWTALYAPTFHPGLRYTLREADEETGACGE